MISRASIVVILLLGAAASGLYQLKYDVAALEARAESLGRTLDMERQALHVLNAEWAYLNKPERLAELADRYLDLVPIGADQIVTVDAVPHADAADHLIADAESTP